MEDYTVIDKALSKYSKCIINIVTVEELDNLKTSRDFLKARSARKALKRIEEQKKNIQFCISKRVSLHLKAKSHNLNVFNPNDDIILTTAIKFGSDICTEDIGLKIKAEYSNVKVVDLIEKNKIYKGYKKFKFNCEEYNHFFENKEKYFNQFEINEYLIIEHESGTDEYRFNGEDFVMLRLPSSKVIKGKTPLQRCALDMLNNKDIGICAILGMPGSGKTYLSLRMALSLVRDKGAHSKILGVREAIGEGKDVGYLKGDFEDKTHMFFAPIAHSLDGGEQEMQKMVYDGILSTAIPFYMKGTTYNDTIMVCDEAEDLSERQIRLVGTRIGDNSRIFFSGDYKQGVVNATTSNPLVKMCNELKGNPSFACVYLDEDVRSEESKIFANLFKNN